MRFGDRLVRLKVMRGYRLYLGSVRKRHSRAYMEKCSRAFQTYNCRLLTYGNGQHVTLYDNPIAIGKRNENFNKSYKNKDREKEDEEHCRKVSYSKTKNTIYNIARSNKWDWFVTLTFDRKITDSSDYDTVVRKLSVYLNNLCKRKCPDMKYLIVPELHSDVEHYHFHGLFADCPELGFVFSGKFDRKSDRAIFNIPSWSWGFTTATAVGDSARASSYITKYITKDSDIFLKNKKRYYTNRNTCRAAAEKLNIDRVDFLGMYADDITYIRDITIPDAHRRATYIEMPYRI